MEDKEVRLEEENVVKMNGMGVYKTPIQEIFIDEEGNTKEVAFEIVKPQNLQIYMRAYAKLLVDGDIVKFLDPLLGKMIQKPVEARKLEFFEHDVDALIEMANLFVEIMGKNKEDKKRKLLMKLKQQRLNMKTQ